MRNKPELKMTFYCILETLFINAVIYYVFFMLNPVKDDFLKMNLHPLFITSSLIGLRYGNYLGILSATICSFTYFFAYYNTGRETIVFVTSYSYYKFWIMFYMGGIILGKFKDNRIFEAKNLREEKELWKNTYEYVKDENEEIRKVMKELKKQIVGAEYSILSLYEIASSLDSLNPEEVYTKTMAMLIKFLKAEQVSLYTLEGDYLRLKVRSGNIRKVKGSIKVEEGNGFYEVVNTKQVVRWDDGFGEDFPMVCAPLLNEEEVIGVINVEEIGFEDLTEYSINLFKVVVEWVNKALVQAISVEEELNRDKYYEGTKIYKYEDFKERLNEEIKREQELQMEFCMLSYKMGGINLLDMNKRLEGVIRGEDIVGFDSESEQIYFLMPATPKSVLHIVEKKLLAGLNMSLERAEANEQMDIKTAH